MLSSAARVTGMKTPRFGAERVQLNDENKSVLLTTTKSKPVVVDSSLLKKSRSDKGIEDIPGKNVAKRRVLGDISNSKQLPNDSSVLSRKEGGKVTSKLAKPFPKNNYPKAESATKSNFKLKKVRAEEYSNRKQQSVIQIDSSVQPLTKAVLYNDEETIELPAGRLLGEGPASTFFDPVCSFELDDDTDEETDKYHNWTSFSEKLSKELEQEIRSSDQRLETSLEKLYQDDLCGFLSSFHVASDASLLLEEDEPCLESSWGNHVKCWMDDDISL
jgi:hypothetical protein